MLVPNLFPVPQKDVTYLQGFHPVPGGLFPQSLQETPEGMRESKHLQISVYTCGWLGSRPLGDTGHVHAVSLAGSRIWVLEEKEEKDWIWDRDKVQQELIKQESLWRKQQQILE